MRPLFILFPGAIDYTPNERKQLAGKSVNFKCDKCGLKNSDAFSITEASVVNNRTQQGTPEREDNSNGGVTSPNNDTLHEKNETTQKNPTVVTPPEENHNELTRRIPRVETPVAENSLQAPPQLVVGRNTSSTFLDYAITILVICIGVLLFRKYM